MDTLLLQEVSCTDDLLPFTATRSVLDIRMGILTFREKWEQMLGPNNFTLISDDRAALPANILPTRALAARVREEWSRGSITPASIDRIITHGRLIRYPWHIFQHNGEALIEDFELLTSGRHSAPIPPSVEAINPDSIFIEEGARLQHCVLNA